MKPYMKYFYGQVVTRKKKCTTEKYMYNLPVLDIKPGISAIVLGYIAKTRPCYLSGWATFPVRLWSSYTAQNAWMCTLPNLRDTTTLTEHILAPVSHTCYLWCIQNIGQNVRPTNLFHGSTDSKFIIWPTKFNSRQRQILRHPWGPCLTIMQNVRPCIDPIRHWRQKKISSNGDVYLHK